LQGNVGIVGRSGTLGYEAAAQLKAHGIGVSTSVGIGGDPINGSSFKDILQRFEEDDDTHVICMIGEIGGPQEAEAAAYIKDNVKKPVVAYVAGLTAPKGRTMGHAGAIVGGKDDTAEAKKRIMRECGIHVVDSPATKPITGFLLPFSFTHLAASASN
jgi:succinyl-CoA synthetase alpha subunit/malate-CoA ligase subunit alpha